MREQIRRFNNFHDWLRHKLKLQKKTPAIRHFCLDIDECAMKIDNCTGNAICNNTEGSFNCSCKPGFSGDGMNCTGNYNMPK